jgi:putative addiction module component (TIGR02574 family)
MDEPDSLEPKAECLLSPQWREEIRRRSAELDAGQVQTIPWEQILAAALLRAGKLEESH